MSEAKYTKGPWEADIHCPDKRNWGWIRPADGEKMQGALKCPSLARVYRCQCSLEEAEANASLIAAAPELFEACKLILSNHQRAGGSISEAQLDWVRAAVRKAEGR